ncbi:hypothetical protein OB13_02835 [Pontibacter sp. HJ8]
MENQIKLIFIILCVFLGFVLQSKAQKTDKEFLITATSVGNVALGMSMQDAIRISKQKYNVEEIENGFLASLEGENLFYFSIKRQDDKVGFIEVYSPKFHTKDGMKIGLDISEAIKGKNIRMGFDGLSGEEYLAPDEFQVPNERFYESLCLFYVSSNVDELLGDYGSSDNEESTYRYKTNGKISKILIYYWN